jgi:hypothetical protein
MTSIQPKPEHTGTLEDLKALIADLEAERDGLSWPRSFPVSDEIRE